MAVRDNLTPSNVTAKIARELFVLKVLNPFPSDFFP